MTLHENDYLTFLLYTASKDARVKRSRLMTHVAIVAAFLLFALMFYMKQEELLVICFLAISVVGLVFWPTYLRWRYRRHYLGYVRANYKNKFGVEATLEFTDEAVITKDIAGEVKINYAAIEEVSEIRDFYFIKSRSAMYMIISKAKSKDIEIIKSKLESLISSLGIRHNIELDWKWK
jgi:hypothetical protein